MSKITLNEQDNSIYRDQQFISISYNGNTNNLGGSTPPQPYELPIASATTLGGIKVGNNLNITADGTLNAVGGSGGGAQPDWNQSDSTAPDYVKNRPFYKEIGEEITEEFTGGEIDFDLEDYPNDVSLTKSEFSHEISEGSETTLTLFGESGQSITKRGVAKALTLQGMPCFYIGNLAIQFMGEDTGEDYLLYFVVGETAKTVAGVEFYGKYTQIDEFTEAVTKVECSFVSVVYHKIDKVYIPELNGYIKSSSSVTENDSNIAIGKNVYIEEQSSKNIIASDNMTIVDMYNPDRHNTGLYYINSGEYSVVGNIYLYDQSNIFIGIPLQEGGSSATVGSITDDTFTTEVQDLHEDDSYFIPLLDYEEVDLYFKDFNYFIGCSVDIDNYTVTIERFFPKDPKEAAIYGMRGIEKEENPVKYSEILDYVTAEMTRYREETGYGLHIRLYGELYSTGGQGNVVIGTEAGATKDTGDSIIIGHGAFVDGDTYWGGNIAIGKLAKVTAPHASIVIGENTSARYSEHVVIGSGTSDYNENEDISYSINIKDKIRVIDNSKDVEFPESRAMIINSSTPGSTKKFKITVDDSGTISATEV